MPKRKQRDAHDALVFHRKEEDEELHANHVRKKDKRTKGVEVVFDPAQHKDFITGFRKRKQQRRKEAQEQIKERERQQRIANRAEKRSKLKEELGLDDNWGDNTSELDSDGGKLFVLTVLVHAEVAKSGKISFLRPADLLGLTSFSRVLLAKRTNQMLLISSACRRQDLKF
ncbi:nucleolar protein 12-domain-containing protein [Dunaliella salina]|uniref:Nucleolar protein 12-domain-containing protein n=1 Tax=Dunaliella salina TaxID=3046 RepID=A0ABQ7GT08_DUNSA|nr:nucleolar protein 12-domain-containing protein [Dunaliella salina]|eukprot:KAF5837747.1 nucleolar protein 12-domain-containing protein [Dunaliella salina]